MLSADDLAVILMWLSSTLFATTVGFAIAWVRARERAVRAESAARPIASRVNPDQLERAVDAIALEVERISEGQRFVTRLLAEGAGQARQSGRLDGPRVNTPH